MNHYIPTSMHIHSEMNMDVVKHLFKTAEIGEIFEYSKPYYKLVLENYAWEVGREVFFPSRKFTDKPVVVITK